MLGVTLAEYASLAAFWIVVVAIVGAAMGKPLLNIAPRGLSDGSPGYYSALDVADWSVEALCKTVFFVNVGVAACLGARQLLTRKPRRPHQ